MKKTFYALLACFLVCQFAFAQVDRSAEDKKMGGDDLGWKRGGSLGGNFGGMGFLNPRAGAGSNLINLGGLIGGFSNKKGTRSYWDNSLDIQLGAQRIARDVLGFQKTADLLRLASRYGYKLDKKGKIYVAIDGLAQTSVLKSYQGNYLKGDEVISKFFSPLNLILSPGIDFRPTAHLSFFFAPAAYRLIYVADDNIAQMTNAGATLHGNRIKSDGTVLNNKVEIGAHLIAKYENKFLGDRLNFASTLRIFADYLEKTNSIDGQGINPDIPFWRNVLSFAIYKGLNLEMVGEMNYDNDILVQKDLNNNRIFGDTGDGWGRGGQYFGSFLISYKTNF